MQQKNPDNPVHSDTFFLGLARPKPSLGFFCNILDTTPEAQSMKAITDKLDFAKIKNICSANNSVHKIRQALEWGKIFAKRHTWVGGAAGGERPECTIYKELLKISNREINNPIEKAVAKELHRRSCPDSKEAEEKKS